MNATLQRKGTPWAQHVMILAEIREAAQRARRAVTARDGMMLSLQCSWSSSVFISLLLPDSNTEAAQTNSRKQARANTSFSALSPLCVFLYPKQSLRGYASMLQLTSGLRASHYPACQ